MQMLRRIECFICVKFDGLVSTYPANRALPEAARTNGGDGGSGRGTMTKIMISADNTLTAGRNCLFLRVPHPHGYASSGFLAAGSPPVLANDTKKTMCVNRVPCKLK